MADAEIARLEQKNTMLCEKMNMQIKQRDQEEEDRCTELQALLRHHASDRSEREMKFCELQSELDKAKVDLYGMNLRVTEREAEVETLRGQVHESAASLATALQKSKGVAVALHAARQENSQSGDSFEELKALQLKYLALAKQIIAEKQTAGEKIATIRAETKKWQAKCEAHEKEMDALSDNIHDVREGTARQGEERLDSMEVYETKLSDAARELKKIHRELEAKSKDCARKESRIAKLHEKLQEAQNQSFGLDMTMGDACAEVVEELEQKLLDQGQELALKGKDIAKREKKIVLLERALAELRSAPVAGANGSTVGGDIEILESRVEELEMELAVSSKHASSSAKELSKQQRKIKSLETQLQTLTTQNADSGEPDADEMAAAEARVEHLDQQVAQQTDKLTSKAKDLTRSEKKVASLEKTLATNRDQLDSRDAEIKQLQQVIWNICMKNYDKWSDNWSVGGRCCEGRFGKGETRSCGGHRESRGRRVGCCRCVIERIQFSFLEYSPRGLPRLYAASRAKVSRQQSRKAAIKKSARQPKVDSDSDDAGDAEIEPEENAPKAKPKKRSIKRKAASVCFNGSIALECFQFRTPGNFIIVPLMQVAKQSSRSDFSFTDNEENAGLNASLGRHDFKSTLAKIYQVQDFR